MLIHDNAKKVATIVNKSPAWVSKHLTITATAFAPTIAELLDRNIVGDLETLLLLNQIAHQPASNPDALPTLTRMLRIAHAGDMNRQIARDALAKLKTPHAQPPAAVTTTTTHTQANHQTSLQLEEADPRKTFSVALPIKYMAEFEQRGGIEWLVQMLESGKGPNGET